MTRTAHTDAESAYRRMMKAGRNLDAAEAKGKPAWRWPFVLSVIACAEASASCGCSICSRRLRRGESAQNHGSRD